MISDPDGRPVLGACPAVDPIWQENTLRDRSEPPRHDDRRVDPPPLQTDGTVGKLVRGVGAGQQVQTKRCRAVEGAGCPVIRLELTDQPANKRLWWFVNHGQSCRLCVHDPGFEVDLCLACILADIIYIIRGDHSLTTARPSDRLEIIAARSAIGRLESWLNLGPVT